MIRPLFLSLLEQRNLLLSGKISSYELTKEYIERIQKLNGHLNIIIRKNFSAALQKAQELDKHLKVTGQPIGPLHGVPFTIKDALRVKHFGTSYGFPGFNLLPAFDNCTVVERLLEAGGVFLGQTNVPLACFDWQTNSPVYGLTRNPLDDTRTVGGSSGGSAASVAAFFSPFEIGADVAGSIRYPAHCCGVFGLRPTHGFVPFSDTGPVFHKDSFHNLVVAGPLARSIDDLKLVLSVITATEDNAKYKQKLKIAYTMHWSGIFVNQKSDEIIRLFIEQAKQLGHELVEITPEIDFNHCTEIWGIILGYEFKQLLPAAFRFKLFIDIFNFFFNTKRFHTGIFKDSFQKGLFANRHSYQEALDSAAKLREKFLYNIRDFDFWLTPVAATEAIPTQETGTWQLLNSERIPYATCLGNFLVPTALFHHPVVAAPIGSMPLDFPISVQLHGKPMQDWQLLSDCARLEELFATGSRCKVI